MAHLFSMSEMKEFGDDYFHGWLEGKRNNEVRPVSGFSYLTNIGETRFRFSFYDEGHPIVLPEETYGVKWRCWKDYPNTSDLSLQWLGEKNSSERTYTRREVDMLLECMFDGAWNAASLKARGDIDWEDSRDVFHALSEMAWNYETAHNFHMTDTESDDGYFEDIDVLSVKTLKEKFGKMKEE